MAFLNIGCIPKELVKKVEIMKNLSTKTKLIILGTILTVCANIIISIFAGTVFFDYYTAKYIKIGINIIWGLCLVIYILKLDTVKIKEEIRLNRIKKEAAKVERERLFQERKRIIEEEAIRKERERLERERLERERLERERLERERLERERLEREKIKNDNSLQTITQKQGQQFSNKNNYSEKKIITKVIFSKVNGQHFNTKCSITNIETNEVIAQCKQGQIVNIVLYKPIRVKCKMNGCFGTTTFTLTPGNIYGVYTNSLGAVRYNLIHESGKSIMNSNISTNSNMRVFISDMPKSNNGSEILKKGALILGGMLLGSVVGEAMDSDDDGLLDSFDTDGDGIDDAFGYDTDGDGAIDMISMDSDGDGVFDTIAQDMDGDGAIDTISYDADGDGNIDIMEADLDGDGRMETASYDTDGDGNIDVVQADYNGDGKTDFISYDSDGDGIKDIITRDVNFDGKVDIVAKDLDGDGTIDKVYADRNFDGNVDFIAEDSNGNGNFERIRKDNDFNGTLETLSKDYDDNGTMDISGIDIDGNGNVDLLHNSNFNN